MGYVTSQMLLQKSISSQKFIHGFCDKEYQMDEVKIKRTLNCESMKVIRVDQQHTTHPVWIGSNNQELVVADAMVTQTPDLLLCVKTADCVPILIYDESSHMIAAIHAGWKGLCFGIIENTVQMMIDHNADLKGMIVAVGPCIQKASFEVDQKVVEQFKGYESYFESQKETSGESKFLGDLPQIAKAKMEALGILQIDILSIDTYQDDRFFSYRKGTHQGIEEKGRQMSCIALKQDSCIGLL